MTKTIIAAIFAVVLAAASTGAMAASATPLPTTPGGASGVVILEKTAGGETSATAGHTAAVGTIKENTFTEKAIYELRSFYKDSIKFVSDIFTAN